MQVKSYVKYEDRQLLVEKVVSACMISKDNISTYSEMLKTFFTHVYTLETYTTDMKFTIDEEGKYTDLLKEYNDYDENGIFDELIDIMNKSYFQIQDAIDAQIKINLQIENSVEGVIARLGTSLLAKLDDYLSPENVEKVTQALKSLDPKILKNLTNVLKVVK